VAAAGRPGRGRVARTTVVPALHRLFAVEGRLEGWARVGHGHIHDTFVASYSGGAGGPTRIVYQRLNTDVFADPDLLAANVARVVAHLDGREAPRPVPARVGGGTSGVVVADGSRWRAWRFVEGRTVDRFENPAQARAAGGAIARLTARLADLPGPALVEPIAGFHDFGRRMAVFEAAVAADARGRVGEGGPEIDAVRRASSLAADFRRAVADDLLPTRLVHNDAKAENLVFDEAGCEVRAVVDLDTVAPGTVLFDVGDLIRSGAATGPEDDPDPAAVDVDRDLAAGVVEGYTAAGADFLTDGERECLPLAGPLMAFEVAQRFLTDHLAGDVYFQVHRPDHNLARARTQLRLVDRLVDR